MDNSQNCRALTCAILGSRGRIPVDAHDGTRFAQVSLDFMKVVRELVSLRLLCRNTQDQEEVYMCVRVCFFVMCVSLGF